jgi:polyhydroxybutyrate depolymerase
MILIRYLSGTDWRTFEIDGTTRKYLYHGPKKGLGENQALVAVLHGFMGNAITLRKDSQFNSVADMHNFAVVYPQGSEDYKGRTFYNVGYEMHRDEVVDDSNFIMELMLFLARENNLSMKHLFVTGFSNGGDIIYQMGCLYPHILAGVTFLSQASPMVEISYTRWGVYILTY